MKNKTEDALNLIFIFADQLGACYMGTYGHPQVQTPCIDRLAKESVQFNRAYTASPLCTPFRGTLLTGRYPYQSGIVRNSQPLPKNCETLADRFNQAGYNTSYVGKWHLTECTKGIFVPEEKRGGFKDFVGWDCGHSRHLDQQYFDGDDNRTRTMQGHETDVLTDLACERIDRHATADKPFCMFISYQAPHPFCNPPEEYYRLYRDRDLAYRPTVDHDACFYGYGADKQKTSLKDWTERYFGEISQLDAQIGSLVEHIDNSGLKDNTVIVFTSDHGDMAGAHGLFEKNTSHEEAIHIPLLIRSPRIRTPQKTDNLFSSIDFFPTVSGLCSLPVAEYASGIDHSSWLHSKNSEWAREDMVLQLKDWTCLYDGEHKLTTSADGSKILSYYKTTDDPFEQNNRKDDPQAYLRIRQMQQRLQKHNQLQKD